MRPQRHCGPDERLEEGELGLSRAGWFNKHVARLVRRIKYAFLLPQGVITHWLADTHGHGSVPYAGPPQKSTGKVEGQAVGTKA